MARAVREKNKDLFENVILLLGGFQAHNYMKCIGMIMSCSGAEIILSTTGLCAERSANKIFGEKADYYQSLTLFKKFGLQKN